MQLQKYIYKNVLPGTYLLFIDFKCIILPILILIFNDVILQKILLSTMCVNQYTKKKISDVVHVSLSLSTCLLFLSGTTDLNAFSQSFISHHLMSISTA